MLPIICICHPGTRDIPYFKPKQFFTCICPLLITFATKLYLPSETYISYNFFAGYRQKRIFKGDCLFVRRKRHARVRIHFFFRSSHGVGRIITYKVLVVISRQTDFALKIALKC